jgi:hypothetical protein
MAAVYKIKIDYCGRGVKAVVPFFFAGPANSAFEVFLTDQAAQMYIYFINISTGVALTVDMGFNQKTVCMAIACVFIFIEALYVRQDRVGRDNRKGLRRGERTVGRQAGKSNLLRLLRQRGLRRVFRR